MYDLITASVDARSLFSKDWMPGFLNDTNASIMIAVKCKRILEMQTSPHDLRPSGERRNMITPSTLFAFKDNRTETPTCFENARASKSPVRVAVWDGQRCEYVDRGWGLPISASQDFYVFDVSDAVQSMFASTAYPTDPNTVARARPSHSTMYKEHVYDSLTEARHAVFFDALGLAYTPHPRCTPTLFGDWTVDFYIDHLETYVEIKPTEPSLEEQMRCVNVVMTERVPVVILFGEMNVPFWRIDGARGRCAPSTYVRKKPGVHGIRYSMAGDRVASTPVVWVERSGVISLAPVELPVLDLSWETRTLVAAYESARTYQFDSSSP